MNRLDGPEDAEVPAFEDGKCWHAGQAEQTDCAPLFLIADFSAGRFAPRHCLGSARPSAPPVILLCHRPEAMAEHKGFRAGIEDKPKRTRADRPMEVVQWDGTFVGPGCSALFETAPSATSGILEGGC